MEEMFEFQISAPGRIILSGEHAIMYEKRVVSASLDRRTTLNFYELPNEQGIEIRFPNVNLSLDVPLETVANFLLYDDMVNIVENKTRLIKYVRHFITFNGMWSTHEQKFSLQIFFFLLSAFAYYDGLAIRPFRVDVSTDLSIGGGLGSSTSFAVCLAACFRHWARLQQGDHDVFDENDLSQIYEHSALCEEFIQNFAFAFDNYVCIHGKITYSKFENGQQFTIDRMDVPEMKILLINSNICQNNRERLQKVAKIKHNNTIYADGRLRAINEISKKIYDKLKIINSQTNPEPNPTLLELQATTYNELQEHIRENQKILYESGLSHPTLENICSIAQSCGFAGKFTGFGGGFVYILLPPSTQEEQMTNLSTQLEAEGFSVTETSVSCSGVKIDD